MEWQSDSRLTPLEELLFGGIKARNSNIEPIQPNAFSHVPGCNHHSDGSTQSSNYMYLLGCDSGVS